MSRFPRPRPYLRGREQGAAEAALCGEARGGSPASGGGALALQFLDDCFSTIENGLLHRFADHSARKYRRFDDLQVSHELVFR